MALPNPNSFDYFKNGEVFPYVKGKINTNNFDFFKNGEVFSAILQNDIITEEPVVPSASKTKRRIFIIE